MFNFFARKPDAASEPAAASVPPSVPPSHVGPRGGDGEGSHGVAAVTPAAAVAVAVPTGTPTSVTVQPPAVQPPAVQPRDAPSGRAVPGFSVVKEGGKTTIKKVPRQHPKIQAEKEYFAAVAARAATNATAHGESSEHVAMPDGAPPPPTSGKRRVVNTWVKPDSIPEDWYTRDTPPWKVTADGKKPETDTTKFTDNQLKEWCSFRDGRLLPTNHSSVLQQCKQVWPDFAHHQLEKGLPLDLKDPVPIMDYLEMKCKGRDSLFYPLAKIFYHENYIACSFFQNTSKENERW